MALSKLFPYEHGEPTLNGPPETGARVYYLRNILHDYPDKKATIILKNTVAALGADSVILIDEIIVPKTHAHPRCTEVDMVMMASLASMERTERQWNTLLDTTGLKIRESKTYNNATGESVIVVVPK